MKRIYPYTIIGKNGESLQELVNANPRTLEYFFQELNHLCIYKEDIIKMQNNISKDIILSEKASYSQAVKEKIHKSNSACTIIQLKIKKEISFTPEPSQVIYVEGRFEPIMNNFIQQNIHEISSLFEKKNKTFIYLPTIINDIKHNFSYYNPTLQIEPSKNDLTSKSISDQLFTYSLENIPVRAGLIRYNRTIDDYYLFSYYIFDNLHDIDLLKYFEWYTLALEIDYLACPCPAFPSYIEDPDDNADYNFDQESQQLIEEIKERLKTLKQKGINELILKSLFSSEPVNLSRLVITNKYKIILPDYNNMEITMYPLPKAVFFLFLNHPEGILFKHLPDYRDELITIYKKISGRENLGDMEKSINDVVNPTLNSINEKCSRIREAFIKHFDESIAKNYFVTGERASLKRINLNRDLVILDNVEINTKVIKTPFKYIKHKQPYNQLQDSDDLPF